MRPAVPVAIVGGGIVGASCACFLAERGVRPLLLEAGQVGREASGANAGGVRQQGRLLAEMPLALESVGLWADLGRRLGVDVEYERCGDLRIAETPEAAARLREVAAREAAAGLRLEWVEGAALRSLVPGIGPRVLAGTFCPTGGQANPLVAAPAFARRAAALGATVRTHCPVRAVTRDGGGFALDTAEERVQADRVVLAAGAWTPGLAAGLGLALPIALIAPQMVATTPMPRLLGTVLLGFGRSLSMKQMRSGAVLIGGGRRGAGDLATREKRPSADNIRLGAGDAVAVLPLLARAEVVRSWAGLEGITPDELPIIDRAADMEAYVAAGFSAHGFAIGPVVGRLLCEWLLDGRPSLDLGPFRMDRGAQAAPRRCGPTEAQCKEGVAR